MNICPAGFRKNIIFALIVAAFLPLCAVAAVAVRDAETGSVLPKASVFDRNGAFIGVTGDDGTVPSGIPKGSYPLNIRYLGYNPVTVESSDAGNVMMTEASYALPELTTVAGTRNMLHITAYVRNYLTRINGNDTIVAYEEQVIDFMFPTTQKAKEKGWKKARILSGRRYEKGIKAEKDTVKFSERAVSNGFDYKLNEKFIMPEGIFSGTSSIEVVPGKYGQKEVWRAIGNNVFLEKDELADNKDHIRKASLAKIFAMSMAMDQTEYKYKFNKGTKNRFTPDDILEASFLGHLNMTGKGINYAYDTKDPIDIYVYGEMFVIDKEYLTAEDAKDLKKNPPVIKADFKAPANIPLPPAEMLKLKERVLSENPHAH